MSRPTDNEDHASKEDQEIREGTDALKDIADEVEAEREESSGRTSLPSDEAEEAAQPPLEDRKDEDEVQPEDAGTVRVNPVVRPMM